MVEGTRSDFAADVYVFPGGRWRIRLRRGHGGLCGWGGPRGRHVRHQGRALTGPGPGALYRGHKGDLRRRGSFSPGMPRESSSPAEAKAAKFASLREDGKDRISFRRWWPGRA